MSPLLRFPFTNWGNRNSIDVSLRGGGIYRKRVSKDDRR